MLQHRQVRARQVPEQHAPNLKERGEDFCETLLRRSEAEGDGFQPRLATGDDITSSQRQSQATRNDNILPCRHQRSSVQLRCPEN